MKRIENLIQEVTEMVMIEYENAEGDYLDFLENFLDDILSDENLHPFKKWTLVSMQLATEYTLCRQWDDVPNEITSIMRRFENFANDIN